MRAVKQMEHISVFIIFSFLVRVAPQKTARIKLFSYQGRQREKSESEVVSGRHMLQSGQSLFFSLNVEGGIVSLKKSPSSQTVPWTKSLRRGQTSRAEEKKAIVVLFSMELEKNEPGDTLRLGFNAYRADGCISST